MGQSDLRLEVPELFFSHQVIQARKRHRNINFLVWLQLGGPRVCPRDLAASYTHRFGRSTFQCFSYATFRLHTFSVAVWRGSEGVLFFFFLCHVETSGNQWTGAELRGASLAHARTRKQWTGAHLEESFTSFERTQQKKTVDRCTFSRARVGVFYTAP